MRDGRLSATVGTTSEMSPICVGRRRGDSRQPDSSNAINLIRLDAFHTSKPSTDDTSHHARLGLTPRRTMRRSRSGWSEVLGQRPQAVSTAEPSAVICAWMVAGGWVSVLMSSSNDLDIA